MMLTAPAVTSCSDDDDDFSTNQFKGGVHLNVFGPSPVARGGQLRFIGSGMDQITKITIPGCGDITDIEVINEGEIRITVPQTAEPGLLTLTYAGGTITTKTELTYLEPISIDAFTPTTVKPGQELTISGEYLNLIHEVCFSFEKDSCNVYEEDFTAHSRNEIKLIVPAEAITGPIAISDAAEMPNMIFSEEDLTIVIPSIAAPMDLTSKKGGDRITIAGNDFDLITRIIVPNDKEVDFTYSAEAGSVTFTLPADVADGPVIAETASLVQVAIANIGVVVPTQMVATPDKDLRGGMEVTVKGLNMDQIVSIAFPGVEGVSEPSEIDGSHVKFVWPDAAQSGDVTFNLKSGKTVVCAMQTAKPQVTGFNPVSPSVAGPLTIAGHNLDLVASIKWPGGTVMEKSEFASQSASDIALTVPSNAETGALTLNMANGESVTTESLSVALPECAYVTESLTAEPMAGETMTFKIANEGRLTGVKVDGQTVQYILNGQTLIVQIPTTARKGSTVTLVSNNGEISYTYDITPATHVENQIWSGLFDLQNWDAGGLRIYKDALEGVPAGALLTFHLSAPDGGQIQINDANWGQLIILDVPAGATEATYELTADALNRLLTTSDGWSETAIVVNGCKAVLSSISVSWEQSLETTIWEGSSDIGNWGGNQDLAWGGYDWTSVKPGQILRFYLTPTVAAGDWWCISLRHGDGWGNIPGIPAQYDTPALPFEFVLTQDVIDDLNAKGGLVVTGANFIMTKVTIE